MQALPHCGKIQRKHYKLWKPSIARSSLDQFKSSIQPNSTRKGIWQQNALKFAASFQKITKAISNLSFAKIIRPYSVVENDGFCSLITLFELRYVLSTQN